MSVADYLVLIGGLAAIVWVNWYFFFAGRRAPLPAATAAGRQEVTITVHGGYEPPAVRVRKGEPVRLVFDRQESSGCSEEVVLPDFGVRRFLPPFEKTVVEVTPQRAGAHEFTCGMGMLRGTLIVE